jgi:U2-associated protein SR140
LYSVKIMWPRTSEERARQRHTGFVCFMNRSDAEDALQSCDNADPFNVGRRITLRWGKNVKMIVKKGAGGTLIAPILQKQAVSTKRKDAIDASPSNDVSTTKSTSPGKAIPHRAVYNAEIHEKSAIRVVIPPDAKRAQFISTIASFVAKDGTALERALVERDQGGSGGGVKKNPAFDFLSWRPCNSTDSSNNEQRRQHQQEEHIFYKWRVYAFCHGDGYHTWRMDPFVMLEPHGCFWIPPPMDHDKAQRELEHVRLKEEAIAREKQQRRLRHLIHRPVRNDDYVTGRKLEQARSNRGGGGPNGGAMLSTAEMLEFHRLFRQQLCASREAICEAMAFCFEKSAAAKQISDMIKDLLLELGPGTSVETRIARLYLLSDILFNTQQPGIRLAFFYRDAIERMAPESFAALGKNTGDVLGRMSLNKLSNAVSSVLAAWTNWSVYDPAFLDELQARFEGRELKPTIVKKETSEKESSQEDHGGQNQQTISSDEEAEQAIVTKPQGEWKEASSADQDHNAIDLDDGEETDKSSLPHEEEPLGEDDGDDEDADGVPLEEDDADGAPLEEDDADGVPLEEDDADGVPLEEDDADGAPLLEDDADAAPLEQDHGAPL